MFKRKNLSLLVLFVVALTTSGCLQVNTGQDQNQVPDAGFFVSPDKGLTWQQRTAILSTTEAKNFSLESAASLAVDPNNTNTIYFGTVGKGLLYTTDKGLSWQIVYDIGPGTVLDIAIDPKDKCKVYASIANKLFKTDDCNRTWENVYTDSAANVRISGIEIDPTNSKNIYISLSRGDIVKSGDEAKSWQTISRFNDDTKKFWIDPNDPKRMYADIGKRERLQMSNDGGKTWESLKESFTERKIAGDIVSLVFVKDQPNLLYAATKYGVLRSRDKAETWEQVSIIPPAQNAYISSLSINPKDTKEIYYTSGSTLFKSVDEGENWSTKQINSRRTANIIEVDSYDPNILFVGF